ncbi:MAG: WbqC family protein [bacterium]
MIASIHQPHFYPWLGYFDKIDRSDVFVILDNCQYKKQEYQNRNKIKTTKGSIWVTVPALIKGRSDQNINEVMIDYSENWRKRHLNLLKANYREAQFFEMYYNDIESFYMSRRWETLSELNIEMLDWFFERLGITTPARIASELNVEGAKTERNVNICKAVEADVYLSGQGAKSYLEENLFAEAGIELRFQEYRHPVYPQTYGEFEPYLSVVDLLFNAGGRSLEIIREGRKTT